MHHKATTQLRGARYIGVARGSVKVCKRVAVAEAVLAAYPSYHVDYSIHQPRYVLFAIVVACHSVSLLIDSLDSVQRPSLTRSNALEGVPSSHTVPSSSACSHTFALYRPSPTAPVAAAAETVSSFVVLPALTGVSCGPPTPMPPCTLFCVQDLFGSGR